jgi:HSP20 family molecular chaperone IbpA
MKRAPKFAGKLIVLENSEPIAAETEEIQSRIRARAYELSMERGHGGREVDDWISAESEIISVPPVEISEAGGTFKVLIAVAGINPADLKVMAAGSQLLLTGDYRHQHDPDAGTIHLCDFKSATVFRSIELPSPVEPASMEIQFEDGLIRISAAKAVIARHAPEAPTARAAEKPAAKKAAAKKGRKAARA